jgi:hypothetical protein
MTIPTFQFLNNVTGSWRWLLAWFAGFCLGLNLGAQPVLTNVNIAQRAASKLVDISYDLAGDSGVTYTVSFTATRDNGTSYESIAALTGAVGAGVLPGQRKSVVWDAGAEWPGRLFPGTRVKATAIADGVGTLGGVVKDGLTGAVLPGVGLQFFSGQSIVGSVVTGASGNYSLTLPSGSLRAQLSLSGYVSTSLAVTVVVGQTVEADVVLFAQAREGNGTIQGRAVNSFNASGVAGATVNLRAGVGAFSGAILQTTTTNDTGNYSFLIPSGSYTIEATASGFTTGFSNVVAVGGVTIGNQNVGLTPNLQLDQLRVVLTWGSVPVDLDSHLAGPAATGGRFHAYYSAQNPAGSSVELDVDDTSSFGPETFTISALRPGSYRYWVHDFSNRNNSTSTALSQQSAARVTIYRGTGSGTVTVGVYNVPTGRAGNAWVVFDLDGATGVLTPVNQVRAVASDETIP